MSEQVLENLRVMWLGDIAIAVNWNLRSTHQAGREQVVGVSNELP